MRYQNVWSDKLLLLSAAGILLFPLSARSSATGIAECGGPTPATSAIVTVNTPSPLLRSQLLYNAFMDNLPTFD